jgi:antitoxin component of MazEF toxin-antitoxin module
MRQKLITIGNSKGVIVPQAFLKQYGFLDELLIEPGDDGIILKPVKSARQGWAEQFAKAKPLPLTIEDKEWLNTATDFEKEDWTWK